MQLYLVTDKSWLKGSSLAEVVEEAIAGGVTMVQYREKDALPYEEKRKEALQLKAVCQRHSIPFIINDSVELAMDVGADGVHLGQEDGSLSEARERLGPDKLIGTSAHNAGEAREAEAQGADYLGAGAVFGSGTKKDANKLPAATLKEITAAVKIPVVGIGGIDETNILQLQGCGLAGVAVISGILAKEDVKKAAGRLKELAQTLL